MLKIKEQIGKGLMGTVYKAEYNGKPCVYKIQKYTDLSDYERQIMFNKFAKKYKDRFMTLLTHGVIDNLHLQDSYYLVYQPVLKDTFTSIRSKLTEKEQLQMFYTIIELIDKMRKHGWVHRDIHGKNIMRLSDKWYIVDYGSVTMMKWSSDLSKKNSTDEIKKYFVNDLYNFILKTFFFHPPIKRGSNFESIVEKMKKTDKYKTVEKLLIHEQNKDDVIYLLFGYIFPDEFIKLHNLTTKHFLPKFRKLLVYCLIHVFDESYRKILKRIHLTIHD